MGRVKHALLLDRRSFLFTPMVAVNFQDNGAVWLVVAWVNVSYCVQVRAPDNER